jgi:hypothetical protein
MHRVLRLREHQFFEVASSALSGRVRTRARTPALAHASLRLAV